MRVKLTIFTISVLTLLSCNKSNRIILVCEKTNELYVGSTVYHGGLTIGQVTKIETFGAKKLIQLSLMNNQIKIPQRSSFTIIPSPLGGNANISVTYSNSSNFINSKDTVTANYKEMKRLEDYVSDTTKRRESHQSMEKIAEGFSGLIEATKDTSTLR